MAVLRTFGFLVKGPGYAPSTSRATLDSGQFCTHVVGVSSLDEARQAVRSLHAHGVQLIELCGGFTRDDAEVLRRELDGAVPIGVVAYDDRELQHLRALFSPDG